MLKFTSTNFYEIELYEFAVHHMVGYQKAIVNLFPQQKHCFHMLSHAFASLHNLHGSFAKCSQCLNFKTWNNEEETELLTKLKVVTWGPQIEISTIGKTLF